MSKTRRPHASTLALAAVAATAGGLLLALLPSLQTGDAVAQAAWPINDDVDDPAVWGKAFPLHYELYQKSVDMQRTKHGGSEAVPRTPTQADPRSIVARTKVDEDIGLKTMWQGYAFAADFREERGHAYMLEDQRYT